MPRLGEQIIKHAMEEWQQKLLDYGVAAGIPALIGASVGGLMGYTGDETDPVKYALLGALMGGSAGLGLRAITGEVIEPLRAPQVLRYVNPFTIGAGAVAVAPFFRMVREARAQGEQLARELIQQHGQELNVASMRTAMDSASNRLRNLRYWENLGRTNWRRIGSLALIAGLLGTGLSAGGNLTMALYRMLFGS